MKLAIILFALFTTGCTGLFKTNRITPATSTASRTTVTVTEPTVCSPDSAKTTVTVIEEVTATGTGLVSSDPNSMKELVTQAPQVNLPKGTAGGGGMEYSVTGAFAKGPVALYAIGGLALITGVVIAFGFGQKLLGLSIAGAGILSVGVGVLFEQYPWVALVGAGIAVIVLGVFLWQSWRTKRLSKAFGVVVGGVSAAGEPEAVTDQIKALAGDSVGVVKEEVRRAKTEAGI